MSYWNSHDDIFAPGPGWDVRLVEQLFLEALGSPIVLSRCARRQENAKSEGKPLNMPTRATRKAKRRGAQWTEFRERATRRPRRRPPRRTARRSTLSTVWGGPRWQKHHKVVAAPSIQSAKPRLNQLKSHKQGIRATPRISTKLRNPKALVGVHPLCIGARTREELHTEKRSTFVPDFTQPCRRGGGSSRRSDTEGAGKRQELHEARLHGPVRQTLQAKPMP